MQNPKVTISIDRGHASAMEKLKTRWTVRGNRIFSKNMCDAAVLYGNLESSKQGRNLLFLLDRLGPELKFALYPPEEVDKIVASIITTYLKFSGITYTLPESDTTSNTKNEVNCEMPGEQLVTNPRNEIDEFEDDFVIDMDIFESLDRG